MMATLVLTVIGDDQAGLVGALAQVIARHGGNWDRSNMARIESKFAGIVEVSVPESTVDALVIDLEPLGQQGLLDISVEHAAPTPAPATTEVRRWSLHLIGQDRPGIVHEIASSLALDGISIEELQTSTHSAAMSGETMFEANATLAAHDGVDQEAATARLEAIADELMVDIRLDA
jgi:glycine cleavage system regulatory protein